LPETEAFMFDPIELRRETSSWSQR
jgi:hypothetical protein